MTYKKKPEVKCLYYHSSVIAWVNWSELLQRHIPTMLNKEWNYMCTRPSFHAVGNSFSSISVFLILFISSWSHSTSLPLKASKQEFLQLSSAQTWSWFSLLEEMACVLLPRVNLLSAAVELSPTDRSSLFLWSLLFPFSLAPFSQPRESNLYKLKSNRKANFSLS